jgi:hypothetical protein
MERYSSSRAGTLTLTGSLRKERFTYGHAATMLRVDGPV